MPKDRDTIFDESNHIEHITIHGTEKDNLLTIWKNNLPVTIITHNIPNSGIEWDNDQELLMQPESEPNDQRPRKMSKIQVKGKRKKAKMKASWRKRMLMQKRNH